MGAGSQVNIKSFVFNYLLENTYLVWDDSRRCVIIDPGCSGPDELGKLKDYIASENLVPSAIWLTHGHFDHIFGVAALVREYSVPVRMSRGDLPILEMDIPLASFKGLEAPDMDFVTEDLSDGEVLRIASGDEGFPFKVIATPGHTPGGSCFYCEEAKVLFTGDTIFAGSIGRTDLYLGDYDKEITSVMEKLMVLPGDVDILPGHGPRTSVADERTRNPFLQPFNEPWETETD